MDVRPTSRDFDVVIMGAGFAGICQARHLLLNVPGIRVALVDPRPAERRDKDMKVGESMVEIAAMFLYKELGLHEYLIEEHTPKQGLSFHWPKRYDKTDSLDDYFHVWVNREAPIPTFHMNRAKFERDVLDMTRRLGAEYQRGHVLDVDLPPGDATKTVTVRDHDGDVYTLRAKHVVDAAGRRFLIGKRKDNVLTGPENLRGLNNGSAWVRVRNVDRTIFDNRYQPEGTATSRYYGTNHWFGHGHWLWMIPSCSRTMELSVGVMHQHEVIPAESLNSREKFYRFLKANHALLHRIVTSGEEVDFFYWPRVAHRSKQMFSPDNWYVIGDAAYIFDAFYSYGTTSIALAVESVTEIVRAKLAGEPDAEVKRGLYNRWNLCFADTANAIVTRHDKHLGHAGAMSWRIFFEYMWWFGLHVPMYIGKWHLNSSFIKTYIRVAREILKPGGLFEHVYDTFDEAVEKDLNLGLMDVCRADQLGSYSVLDHRTDFRTSVMTEPGKCDVFTEWSWMLRHMAWWYARLQWKTRGVRGIASPANLRWFGYLLRIAAYAKLGGLAHRLRMRGKPKNSVVAKIHEEAKGYRYQPVLQPWGEDLSRDESSAPAEQGPAWTSAAAS